MTIKHKDNDDKKAILLDSYVVMDSIGSGSFGEVYKAKRKTTDTLVAMKTEDRKKVSRIEHEYKIYKKLIKNNVTDIIPDIYDFIQTPTFNIMCMELLGPCLEDLFLKNNRKFSLSTVLKLGENLVKILHLIHSSQFVHRDIKPNNFLIGLDAQVSSVYIMDFGLSKRYIDNKGEHMKFREGRSLIGTARYASLNMHMGIEPSRRDDLESVGYMLIYFANGSLPWQGLKRKKDQNQIEIIGEVKLATSLKNLCGNLPDCFGEYIIYCRNLKFDETPDYDYLSHLFSQTYKSGGFNGGYDWENKY